MDRSTLILLLGHVVAFTPVAGQSQPAIHAGDTIRVTTAPGLAQPNWITGRFNPGAPGSVSITTDAGRDTTFAAADLVRIEVLAGQTRSTAKGIVAGALVGGLGMGLWALAVYEKCEPSPGLASFCLFDEGETFLAGVVFGALVGGVAGGVIGSLIKTDRWRPLELTPYLTSRGRWGIAMRVQLGGL